MIGAVFRGPGHLEVGEVETPEIGSDEVLVKVGANTVCGTDVRILRGEKTREIGRDIVSAHEVAGYLTEVGRNVRGYETGVSESGRVATERMVMHCFPLADAGKATEISAGGEGIKVAVMP